MKKWRDEAPPAQTWVVARYREDGEDNTVKTCKYGCCVHSPVCGSMILPAFWRLATEAEVEGATAPFKPPYKPINIQDWL